MPSLLECLVYYYLKAAECELGLFLVSCEKLELSFMGEPTLSQTVGLVEAMPRMSFVQLHVHSYMCKCSGGSEITELLIGLLNISRASLRTNKRL